MPRILLLILLLWILYIVLKHFITLFKTKKEATNKTATSEKIVACSQCGLHVPENETHTINHTVYCNNPACQPTNTK